MIAKELPELPHTQLADVIIPGLVAELAAGRDVTPIWRNGIGGVTFAIDGGAEYVKHGPEHPEFQPTAEFARLRWVSRYLPSPEPIDHGVDASGYCWLRTRGIAGTSAVLNGWRDHPEAVVPELGRALRRFHDLVPVAGCSWTWSVTDRLAGRATAGFEQTPPVDAVVCHGDACNPNFLLDPDGHCVGYVDLGNLGVADRWADLAPALISLEWNFGPGWQDTFLDGYGIDLDPLKPDFYTRLWNAE